MRLGSPTFFDALRLAKYAAESESTNIWSRGGPKIEFDRVYKHQR